MCCCSQNNGGHPNHDCGFVSWVVSTASKQGSAACWFRDAAKERRRFMDKSKSRQVLLKRGRLMEFLWGLRRKNLKDC